MAHVLGFDLKKYGNLENEKTYPDSEDLYLLYKHFSIPPQLVLGDYWGIVRAIGDVMKELEKGDCCKILHFLEEEIKVIG